MTAEVMKDEVVCEAVASCEAGFLFASEQAEPFELACLRIQSNMSSRIGYTWKISNERTTPRRRRNKFNHKIGDIRFDNNSLLFPPLL